MLLRQVIRGEVCLCRTRELAVDPFQVREEVEVRHESVPCDFARGGEECVQLGVGVEGCGEGEAGHRCVEEGREG